MVHSLPSSCMRRSGSADELMSAPIGAYLAGRSFVVWVQGPRRLGAFHFGPLDKTDHSALATLFPLPLSPALSPPFDVLHDLGAVEVFDRSSFEFFESYLVRWVDELARRTRRLAVVRPSGLAGAAFTGLFHDWVVPRFEAKLCVERAEAQAWLGLVEGAPERHALDELYDSFLQPAFLRRVREVIAACVPIATLGVVAEALATTPRTLQRQLSMHGTSFRDEILRARIRAAEAMLLDRDDKIDVIARELGFSTTASFSAMFHRVEGESPTAFRSRRTVRRRRFQP